MTYAIGGENERVNTHCHGYKDLGKEEKSKAMNTNRVLLWAMNHAGVGPGASVMNLDTEYSSRGFLRMTENFFRDQDFTRFVESSTTELNFQGVSPESATALFDASSEITAEMDDKFEVCKTSVSPLVLYLHMDQGTSVESGSRVYSPFASPVANHRSIFTQHVDGVVTAVIQNTYSIVGKEDFSITPFEVVLQPPRKKGKKFQEEVDDEEEEDDNEDNKSEEENVGSQQGATVIQKNKEKKKGDTNLSDEDDEEEEEEEEEGAAVIQKDKEKKKGDMDSSEADEEEGGFYSESEFPKKPGDMFYDSDDHEELRVKLPIPYKCTLDRDPYSKDYVMGKKAKIQSRECLHNLYKVVPF